MKLYGQYYVDGHLTRVSTPADATNDDKCLDEKLWFASMDNERGAFLIEGICIHFYFMKLPAYCFSSHSLITCYLRCRETLHNSILMAEECMAFEIYALSASKYRFCHLLEFHSLSFCARAMITSI